MPHVGYDVYFAEPGVRGDARCGVCQARCEVRRSVVGPTCLAEAMAGKGHEHDVFVCPHTDQPWHDEALTLAKAIEAQPSKRVAALMRQDLDELLQQHLGKQEDANGH